MKEDILKNIKSRKSGVTCLGNGSELPKSQDLDFESLYLKVRKKEGRVFVDDVVKRLPDYPGGPPLKHEWDIRTESLGRFLRYLEKKKNVQRILELGCGNGWFSNRIKEKFPHIEVYAMDINLTELEQGSRLFGGNEVHFLCGDVFDDIIKEYSFDLIFLPSSLQYFENLEQLFHRLFRLIKKKGEIHVLDTPIYRCRRLSRGAARRSMNYYKKLGYPEMAEFYHHHSFEDLRTIRYKVIYNPASLANEVKKLFGKRINPFHWLVFRVPRFFDENG